MEAVVVDATFVGSIATAFLSIGPPLAAKWALALAPDIQLTLTRAATVRAG
jgi:hypothetical protein